MAFTRCVAVLLSVLGRGSAQQAGRVVEESGPQLVVERCSLEGGCVDEASTATLDANWRWTHDAAGYVNCYTDDEWNPEYCSDPEKCATQCAVEGVNAEGYQNTYGVKSVAGGLELQFVASSGNVGTRLYLLDGDESYKVFKLKNREFSLDVDASSLACGLNGAVYFVEMDPLGGKGTGQNSAGAKFGTGYCDAQCPHDIKWIDGQANLDGKVGICCVEMDIWEANARATAYTAHPCNVMGPHKCEDLECGDGSEGARYMGVCDKDGCDLNAWRMGDSLFYGLGAEFAVDASKPVTVVTQFLTSDGTDQGDLVEIKRLYIQDHKVIASPESSVQGVEGASLTDSFCDAQKVAFDDPNDFKAKGGMKQMGEALDRGLVLALSLWDDGATNMRWLDSSFPVDGSPSQPGVVRGPCDKEDNSPTYLRHAHPTAAVKYTNIRYGEIGSTVAAAMRGRRLGSLMV